MSVDDQARRPRWRTAFVAGLMLATSIPGASAAGRSVDVGGHELRLYCRGRGAPVVILEAGAGDTHQVWRSVRSRVARFTRACSYDRAGLGNSEPGPLPRTATRLADELHTLLQSADIEGPVVLVGHSLGGLVVRLFARSHPERTAGLVLVDATHEDYPKRAAMLRSPRETARLETVLSILGAAARSEVDSIEAGAAELRGSGSDPVKPTIVISAGGRAESPGLRRLWDELQLELADLPGVVEHVVAEESRHGIQLSDPDLVARMVRKLVDLVGSESP